MMKFTVIGRDAAKSIDWLKKRVNSRKGSYGNNLCHINASGDSVTLTVMNLEGGFFARATIDALVGHVGSALLPLSSLKDAFSNPKKELICVEQQGVFVAVVREEAKSFIKISTEEFPPFPQLPEKRLVGDQFQALMRAAVVQTDNNPEKHILSGINLCNANGRLTVVGASSYTMSVGRTVCSEGDFNVVIPAKTCGSDSPFSIGVNDKNYVLFFDAGVVVGFPMEGKYPDYQHIEDGYRVVGETRLSKTALVGSLKRASASAGKGQFSFQMELHSDRLVVHVRGNNGQTQASCPANGNGNDLVQVDKILLKILENAPAEWVTLQHESEKQALRVVNENGSWASYVMPIRGVRR
jgi:DNA polymerase III sliding clamp (beta) subunit (PCNA family)